jgi:hypothetical protein
MQYPTLGWFTLLFFGGFLGSVFWMFFGCFLKPGNFWLPEKQGPFFENVKAAREPLLHR